MVVALSTRLADMDSKIDCICEDLGARISRCACVSEPQTGGSDFLGVRPAAVQRGQAMLVSRCAGMHQCSAARPCLFPGPPECSMRAAALHCSSSS